MAASGPYIFDYFGQIEIPDDVTHVSIHESLEEIPSEAFQGKRDLISVDFTHASNLRAIGEEAFAHCTSLRSLDLSGTKVAVIQREAFANCENLLHIRLGDWLELMDDFVFVECYRLQEITIPQAMRRIPYGTFHSCFSLKVVRLPERFNEIRGDSFVGCRSLKEVHFPRVMPDIRSLVFQDCPLLNETNEEECIYDGITPCRSTVGHMVIAPEVTVIETFPIAMAFGHFLKTVRFHENFQELYRYLFFRCPNLKKVTLPADMTCLEDAFPPTLEQIDVALVPNRAAENLGLLLRVKALYPAASASTIPMARLIRAYSYNPLTMTPQDDTPLEWSDTLLAPHPHPARDFATQKRELQLLADVRASYMESIRELVMFSSGLNLLNRR